MKINTRAKNNKTKFILILLGSILVLAGISLSALYYHNAKQLEAERQTQKTKDEAQTDSAKNDAQPSDGKTSEEVPVSTTISVAINDFKQADGLVSVSANIKDSADKGTCVFLFSNTEDKPVTREVSTVAGATQTCQVSVPEVEFSKLGIWKLTVTYYVNNQKSEASQDVTIN